jgi:hypothetical protein
LEEIFSRYLFLVSVLKTQTPKILLRKKELVAYLTEINDAIFNWKRIVEFPISVTIFNKLSFSILLDHVKNGVYDIKSAMGIFMELELVKADGMSILLKMILGDLEKLKSLMDEFCSKLDSALQKRIHLKMVDFLK